MAILQDGNVTTDKNLGTVAVTILPGAIQVDVVMRLHRADFLAGKSPIICASELEDRYEIAVVQTTGQSMQQALGYPPANFINLDDVGML